MAFLTSKDGTLASARAVATNDGVPYMWNSGNVLTVPSNQIKILAPDGTDGDRFGESVSVSSGRIVVGAYENDQNGSAAGAAYVYDLDGNYITKILASDGAASDRFGYSVAVGGGRIAIGAYLDDGSAVNDSGSVYIYDLNGNYINKVFPSDEITNQQFGRYVAVGSGRIVAGANQDDDKGAASGSAYIYDLNGNYINKIVAPDGTDGDTFGRTVAAGSGRIVIGADNDDDNGTNSGSAYIFDIDGNYISKITAPDGTDNDRFSFVSLASGSGKIVAGAYLSDPAGASSGSAYLFDLDGNYIKKLLPSDTIAGDNFGFSVGIGNGRIVVGAQLDEFSGSANNIGSVIVFDLDGNYIDTLFSSDALLGDRIGYSVSVGSGRIVTGGPFIDTNGTSSGAVYVFTTPQAYTLYDVLELEEGNL